MRFFFLAELSYCASAHTRVIITRMFAVNKIKSVIVCKGTFRRLGFYNDLKGPYTEEYRMLRIQGTASGIRLGLM